MATKAETAGAGMEVRANRYDVISRLADDLAHEIKNPLNAIVVNLEVMRRRIASGEREAALDRVNVIEQEIRRVHGLVDQVLQLMRPARAEASALAVDGMIEGLTPAIEAQAKAARVEYRSRAESSMYAQIRAEPFKFAFLNLVTAAIDLEAASGGAVTVTGWVAEDGIRVGVAGSSGRRGDEEHVRFCRVLIEEAGGSLRTESAGVVTLILPPASFDGSNRTGNDVE